MLAEERTSGRRTCAKTGRLIERRLRSNWLFWLLPIAGLFALVWFLIRVIPKPSRATYPCQRIAAPIACGFLAWLSGLALSAVVFRKARRLFDRSRYVAAGLLIVLSVLAVWWPLGITGRRASAGFTPSDPPNNPLGVARGINPGRVVWVHDANSVSWDGRSGAWWDEGNVHQPVVNEMVSKSICWLTGEQTDTAAWDALFRYFNRTNGWGDVGYRSGEKIAIKLNMNQDYGDRWDDDIALPTPQLVYCVTEQLINVVGVSGSAITIYDATQYVGDPIYDKIRSNPDREFQSVRFIVNPEYAGDGRIAAQPDRNVPIYYADSRVDYSGRCYPPRGVTEADYLINIALFRAHSDAGITSLAKNHFGSVYNGADSMYGWKPDHMHVSAWVRENAMSSPNALVDLMGHEHLGGKTLLFMIDALFGQEYQSSGHIRFESFGNQYPCSIFASQDGVAIESVALDFIRNEPRCARRIAGSMDNYLHEAALADNPPSGAFYDPEGDGVQLESLGVHEHWNNAIDKQYSRNLGTSDGIELITSKPGVHVSADLNKDGIVNFLDFASFREAWTLGGRGGRLGD